MKVIVVDDDPLIVEVVVFKLQQFGHAVLSAVDGREGLRLIREVKPDLAILDVLMPKLSGIELCREVRRDPSIAATRVILLTAQGDEADVVEGFEAGANDYVAKPFGLRSCQAASRLSSSARPEEDEGLMTGQVGRPGPDAANPDARPAEPGELLSSGGGQRDRHRPQHRDRVFKMFQRLHSQDDYAGTGIGLAVCQRIVERHGGTIGLESVEGEGSTFSFTLPASDHR